MHARPLSEDVLFYFMSRERAWFLAQGTKELPASYHVKKLSETEWQSFA